MDPVTISVNDFFARWKQLGEGNIDEAQSVINMPFLKTDQAGVQWLRSVVGGVGFALINGADPEPDNIVGVGIVSSEGGRFGCLVRAEPKKDHGMTRFTVRSTNADIAKVALANIAMIVDSNKYSPLPQFTVRGIDYADETDLVNALAGHDAVLSLIGDDDQCAKQVALVNAASKAGVKYFVPSEFGTDLTDPSNGSLPVFAPKYSLRQAIEASNLGYIYVVTGCFADHFLQKYFTWHLGNPSMVVPGDGTAKNSYITRMDVAKYTVAILKRADEFRNTTVRVTADTLSFNDWIEKVERASGKKVAVTTLPIEDIKAAIDADINMTGGQTTISDQFRLMFGEGICRIDCGENKLDNDKFPDIIPVSIDELVQYNFD
ncbi:hypothetical protein FBU59_001797 [Linderina macrospora]|uniref:Uncharacterized protein n=1 Tax=Linderina macrospora TaxID=4868 RepID=A0ACC1JCZ3_9FUNG|nr:hypothetical protein FBU59_001797 [Linderina macrospora]